MGKPFSGTVLGILDFYPESRIPDLTTAPKEEGGKFCFVLPFFVAIKIIKL
jgi:hypothetical protein